MRHNDARMSWTGSIVCPEDWDPRPPWLDPPYINPLEATPVPNARFDPDADSTNLHFTDDDNPIGPEDL